MSDPTRQKARSEACPQTCKRQRKIDETLARLREEFEYVANLSQESYEIIVDAGFNRATLPQTFALAEIAMRNKPVSLRGLLYRAQAAGIFPDTSQRYYDQAGRIVLKLRRKEIVPFSWIVDSTRRRLKPSSWSGRRDFADDAARSYRLNLWARQQDDVEVFVEKDAMAAVIEPITEEFDVHLNVIRGQVSETFVWAIAEEWREIEKPIHAYYIGDHDPAGLKIEACLQSKLRAFAAKDFAWERLAVTPQDFANHDLLGFPVKRGGKPGSWKPYLEEFGDRCLECDAIAPTEIRDRLRRAIESHIDQGEWEALQEVERLERESFEKVMKNWKRK